MTDNCSITLLYAEQFPFKGLCFYSILNFLLFNITTLSTASPLVNVLTAASICDMSPPKWLWNMTQKSFFDIKIQTDTSSQTSNQQHQGGAVVCPITSQQEGAGFQGLDPSGCSLHVLGWWELSVLGCSIYVFPPTVVTYVQCINWVFSSSLTRQRLWE